MSKNNNRIVWFAIFLFGLALPFAVQAQPYHQDERYVVVIDPGHGGKDPGAIGKYSKEKNINLSVALALGQLIEKNLRQTQVVYTRKTDTFIPLDRRAQIANKAHADLFISIHTNALPKKKIARGAETYTLGMARADENLEVAKRENAVILVEDDYQTRYQGFDPKKAESYIIFEFLQDRYMERSVHFARGIQKEFRNTAKRADKGVHQAGFLVLREVSMPSVLIELGYISTPDEENYLNSKKGIADMSNSIFKALKAYQQRYPKSRPAAVTENRAATGETSGTQKQEASEADRSEGEGQENARVVAQGKTQKKSEDQSVLFKVQILSSTRQLVAGSSHFKGLSPVDSYRENNLYKYTYGATDNYAEAKKIRKGIITKFPEAFIVAFRGAEKMNLQEAIRQAEQKSKK